MGAGSMGRYQGVKCVVDFGDSKYDRDHFISQMVGYQRHYEKWWNEFRVTKDGSTRVIVRASM
jgi:hypothetical protein